MYDEFFNFLKILQKTDSASIPRLVQDRVKELERDAEKTQVLPIKKSYSQYIAPTARCFQNPHQKGVFIDNMPQYLATEVVTILKDAFQNYNCDNPADRQKMSNYVLNLLTNWVLMDYVQPLRVLDKRINEQELFKETGILNFKDLGKYLDEHAYNYAKYNDLTTGRESFTSEMFAQKCASEFEVSLITHNMLKFLGFDTEVVFTDQGAGVLVRNENDINNQLIFPKRMAQYVVETKSDSKGRHTFRACSCAIEHFDSAKQFYDWYYGNGTLNFQSRDSRYFWDIDPDEKYLKEQEFLPQFQVSGLNKTKDNIYQM